ncbi:MAG: tetratricopeptide repeat protein [Chloroflexi bacterium]|nr:tetratricopeptide repeat protein [Chloroflexota bacterium]
MNRRRTRPNWFRIILLCLLVLGGSYVNRYVIATQPSPFVPTPTPTRAPESFVTEAREYFQQGKLIPAIASYQQAILSNPNDPSVYVELAQTQVFAGQYEEAQVSAESAILLNNDNSMAHAVLGWAMGAQGNYIEAGNSIERALTLDPNNAYAHAYYVEILVDSGSFDVIDKAIEESKVAVALAPNALETHRARGYILEATGNYEEAIREYQLAIDMNPKIADLYLSQGRNYRALGSYEDAITAFSNADALNPEDPMPDYLISRTYATRGEFGKAMQYAEQAVTNDPSDPNLRGNLGSMYYQNSYWTESIVEFGYMVNGGFTDEGEQIETIPLTPDNIRVAEYYYMYGLALAKTNKCSPALDIARMILERIPANELAVENANAIISRCELNLEQAPIPLPTATATAPVPTESSTPTP